MPFQSDRAGEAQRDVLSTEAAPTNDDARFAVKLEGQCHCGAITYEAEVQPGAVTICHCLDCQMLTGTAFRASVPAPAGRFRILTGKPREYVKVADSGAKRVHAFCATCGSPIYSCAVDNRHTYSLRLGALSQKEALGRPARQIWTKRRLSWIPKLEGVPDIEGQR